MNEKHDRTGRCQACGRKYALRKDGMVWRHRVGEGEICEGSCKPPRIS